MDLEQCCTKKYDSERVNMCYSEEEPASKSREYNKYKGRNRYQPTFLRNYQE